MKKAQFEHTIRAAGAILGANEVLVIGNQAIHASTDDEIPEALRPGRPYCQAAGGSVLSPF